jgi:hypothetical protein
MPRLVRKLIGQYPFAYYMFIPASFVKEAFEALVAIFERHQKRLEFVLENADALSDPTLIQHCLITKVPYDFVTILQGTLIETLGCPVILICSPH